MSSEKKYRRWTFETLPTDFYRVGSDGYIWRFKIGAFVSMDDRRIYMTGDSMDGGGKETFYLSRNFEHESLDCYWLEEDAQKEADKILMQLDN